MVKSKVALFFQTRCSKLFLRLRKTVDNSEEHVMFIMSSAQPDDPARLPCIIAPWRLSAERQWYLFESIRPLVPAVGQDIICPQLQVDRHTIAQPTAETVVMCQISPTKQGENSPDLQISQNNAIFRHS